MIDPRYVLRGIVVTSEHTPQFGIFFGRYNGVCIAGKQRSIVAPLKTTV
jgi:hypothetical protein